EPASRRASAFLYARSFSRGSSRGFLLPAPVDQKCPASESPAKPGANAGVTLVLLASVVLDGAFAAEPPGLDVRYQMSPVPSAAPPTPSKIPAVVCCERPSLPSSIFACRSGYFVVSHLRSGQAFSASLTLLAPPAIITTPMVPITAPAPPSRMRGSGLRPF